MSKRKLTLAELKSVEGLSSRLAAQKLGVGKSTINDARKYEWAEDTPVAEVVKPRILALDLETSPNLAHVWGLWQQNVGITQIIASTEVICWGARWVGEEEVFFSSVHHDGKEEMLRQVWELLNEADAVMGWNSKGFDSKHLNREFVENGILPPSPWQDLDLMLSVKAAFRFPSNKLDYVAQKLGVGHKVQNRGHQLWIDCLAGNEEAWAEMKEYQIQDVNLLIELYPKLLPWIKGHPNMGLYSGELAVCPNCGSHDLVNDGFSRTGASTFRKYVCGDCGKWSRDSKRWNTTSMRSY